MPKGLRVAWAVCAAALGGCATDDDPAPNAAAHSVYRSPAPAQELICGWAVGVRDPVGDARSWVRKERRRGPAFGDLQRFELMVNKVGVCARWTTVKPAPPGTSFTFGVYGPPYRNRLDVVVNQGHGFTVSVTEDGARVTDALMEGIRETVQAKVRRSGSSVSVFVPWGQLDRSPRKIPDRRPFPRKAFAFAVSVNTPPRRRRLFLDVWPQETQGQAGWVNGRLCLPSCRDRRATGSARKFRPDERPGDHKD